MNIDLKEAKILGKPSFKLRQIRLREAHEKSGLEGYGKVSRKLADQKAYAEYDKFNKQQRIESDFDREVKKLLQNKGSQDD